MSEPEPSPQSVRTGAGQRGLALVIVLWAAIILALIAGSVTRMSRSDLQLTRNVIEATAAELAADSGVRWAIYEIAAGDTGAWRTDGAVYGWRFGQAELRVSITDELGRIDINYASTDVLADLFAATGVVDPEGLASAVEEFRKQRRAMAANVDFSVPDDMQRTLRRGVAFTSAEDLGNVPGISSELVQRLRPSITVYSGRALPVISVATPLVRAAMNAAEISIADVSPVQPVVSTGELSETPALLSVPDGPAPRGSGLYRVHSEALTDGGSHFTREAVVMLRNRRGKAPYVVRLWRRGERLYFPSP